MPAPIDLVGRRFGKLVVVALSKRPGIRSWDCECECGKTITKPTGELTSGHSMSCGCNRLTASLEAMRKANTKHGKCETTEYRSWSAMIRRCYVETHDKFAYYGGRGIRVCDRWKDSFENFLADMGPKPDPTYSIERNDNADNYTPENCRWASKSDQASNRKSSVFLTALGRTQTMQQWSRELNIPQTTIHNRLKRGCDHATALGLTP